MVKVDPCDGSWETPEDQEQFHNLLSLFDFPMESVMGDGLVDQDLGPIPALSAYDLSCLPLIPETKSEPVFLHQQLGLNDAAPEMKQLPYQFEEISGSYIRRQYDVQEQSTFQSQSPISVLESGVGKNLLIKSHINKRMRSKRARPSVNPWLLLSPVFSRKNRETRKKSSHVERAKKSVSDSAEARNAAPHRPPFTKKCAHCEVTKTPQWREGPMGPKTLCNACGVRYRSGRLYPEYRPAASPTFVPSVHSNSHKKVVEMRAKSKQQQVIDIEDSLMFEDFEFIPVSGYL